LHEAYEEIITVNLIGLAGSLLTIALSVFQVICMQSTKVKLWDYAYFRSVLYRFCKGVCMRSSVSWSINILKFNKYCTHFWAYSISSIILTVWGRMGGLDYLRIWTTEMKRSGKHNIQKLSLNAKVKPLKPKILYLTV